MSRKIYNLLCMDLANLMPHERHFLRLNMEHGLSVSDLAEVFSVTTDVARKTLANAQSKYMTCYQRFKW